jgi:hypothetical protein
MRSVSSAEACGPFSRVVARASKLVMEWIVVPGKKSRMREVNSAREEGSSWARRIVGTGQIVLKKPAGRKGAFWGEDEV